MCVATVGVGNTCIVVTGSTAILLDDDSTFVRTKALQAIKYALNDTQFLDSFTDSVVTASFISPLHAALVEYDNDEDNADNENMSPMTVTIAVAAAAVAFAVASIVCYGFLRTAGRRRPAPSPRRKGRSSRSNVRTIGSESLGDMRARRHFVQLHDLTTSPTSVGTASMTPPGADYVSTVAWSVSDITSDSASLPSSVSRTPSKLTRIEEVEEGYEGELADYDGSYDEGSNKKHRGDDEDDNDNDEGEDYHGYGDADIVTYDSYAKKSSASSGRELQKNKSYAEKSSDGRHRSAIPGQNLEDFDCEIQELGQVLDVSDLDPIVHGNEYDDSYQDDEADAESEVRGDRFVECTSDFEISSDESVSCATHASDSERSADSVSHIGDEMGMESENDVQDEPDDQVLATEDHIVEHAQMVSNRKGATVPNDPSGGSKDLPYIVSVVTDSDFEGSAGDDDDDDSMSEGGESVFEHSTSLEDALGMDQGWSFSRPPRTSESLSDFVKQGKEDSIDEWVSELLEEVSDD